METDIMKVLTRENKANFCITSEVNIIMDKL